MFHVLFQSQIAVSTGFMEETWSRNLLNVLTTPVTEVEYVAGTAVFGFVKLAMALLTLTTCALIFYGFRLSSIGRRTVPISTTPHRRVTPRPTVRACSGPRRPPTMGR